MTNVPKGTEGTIEKPCNHSASVPGTVSERSKTLIISTFYPTFLDTVVDSDARSLAYFEIRLIFARMLWNFDFELMEESRDWTDQKVRSLVRPVLTKIMTDSTADLYTMGEEESEHQVDSQTSMRLLKRCSAYLIPMKARLGVPQFMECSRVYFWPER